METISIRQVLPALRVRPLAIVDFMSPSCVPCRAVPAVLQQLQQRTYVPVFIINVEEDIALASDRFHVRALPTVVLYEHGREVARIAGAVDLRSLLRQFGPVLGVF